MELKRVIAKDSRSALETINENYGENTVIIESNKVQGKIEFKAPLVVTAPTYNIIDELKEEGDWDVLQKYSGFEFDITNFNHFEIKFKLDPKKSTF